MNTADRSRIHSEIMALLLGAGEEVHEAYHNDAEFRAYLTTKVQLLVGELDSMVLGAQARQLGMAQAAEQLSGKVLKFTAPAREP